MWNLILPIIDYEKLQYVINFRGPDFYRIYLGIFYKFIIELLGVTCVYGCCKSVIAFLLEKGREIVRIRGYYCYNPFLCVYFVKNFPATIKALLPLVQNEDFLCDFVQFFKNVFKNVRSYNNLGL